MRISLLLTTAIFLLIACSPFKKDMFPEWRDLDEFPRKKWYSNQLRAAKESPIITPLNVPTYRFTWLRSFHHPIVVRIECPDHCTITAKILNGAGGYVPGKISKTINRTLSQSEEEKFKRLLSQVNFSPEKSLEDIIGVDGAQWVLEAASGNSYHAIDYWSPQPGGSVDSEAFYTLCSYMLYLTGFEIPDNEFY